MLIICLWPNDHLCTVWGSIIFVVSEKMILIQFPIRTYAMQCPEVIAILDFLTGKKKTHEKSLYMINHVIIHIQLKRLNQAVFSQNAFLLRVLYWTMLYSSDHNEFFIWPQWIFYMTIMNSLYPNISVIPTGVTSITNNFSEKNIFKISVHQKTYWH